MEKIKGYTLHGDYYLADKVITNVKLEEAQEVLKMKEEITLPNGKTVIAHILSKEELETIPKEERKCGNWYYTSTPINSELYWLVNYYGDFSTYVVGDYYYFGGARLGFKNPFFLEEEQSN